MYPFTTVFGVREESDLRSSARAARRAVLQCTLIDAALRHRREGSGGGRRRLRRGWREPIKGDKVSEAVRR